MNADKLADALREAEPALWLMAASGNKDAVRIHRNILAALAEHDAQPAQAAQPVGVPDGWVMVPRKITPEMEDAADRRDDEEPPSDWGKMRDASRQAIWRAMLAAAPQPPAQPSADAFNFEQHLQRQREWSHKTFGPGARSQGCVDHIRKELKEIEANPGDLEEWIDVAILALDGAWRSGAQPTEIIAALVAKQTKNEHRKWPDWRTADPNHAIEHDRSEDPMSADSSDRRWEDFER